MLLYGSDGFDGDADMLGDSSLCGKINHRCDCDVCSRQDSPSSILT